MATFLTTTDSSAAIERVIREADRSLTLISAFVYPRIVHLQRLRDAGERGVEITVIFGKQPMHQGVFRDLRELPNMRLYFLNELHAKCYFNEREAVVTSLNLLGGSEQKNREMGVLLSARKDARAYAAMQQETKSILRIAEMIHSTMPKAVGRNESSWNKRAAALPSGPMNTVVEGSEIEQVRKEHPRAYSRWSPEEDALLRDLMSEGHAPRTISGLLKRQPSAVSSRLRKLGDR